MNKGKWISDSTGLVRRKPFGRCGGSAPSNYKARGKVTLENYGEGLHEKKEEMDLDVLEMERKIKERLNEKKNEKKEMNIFGSVILK